MKSCAFIGNKNTPFKVKGILAQAIRDLILNDNVTSFYVGTHGAFDKMVQEVLEELSKEYTFIKYSVVLAYLPKVRDDTIPYEKTIYPDGLEKIPPKYAIIERNKWMINQSDILICYVVDSFSNSFTFKEFAEKKGKCVINLFDYV
jgi:uncharacterized phage-like protein YoqJ